MVGMPDWIIKHKIIIIKAGNIGIGNKQINQGNRELEKQTHTHMKP